MTAGHRLVGMFIVTLGLMSSGMTPAVAQDRDAQEVSRYALT